MALPICRYLSNESTLKPEMPISGSLFLLFWLLALTSKVKVLATIIVIIQLSNRGFMLNNMKVLLII